MTIYRLDILLFLFETSLNIKWMPFYPGKHWFHMSFHCSLDNGDIGIHSWERYRCYAYENNQYLIASFLHNWQQNWRRQWHPTPVLLPGKSHGWRSLVGCSPWGHSVRHNWPTSLWLFTFMHWRRTWQPTPVFLPRESQGQGSLVGCRLWGRTELDMTEAT